MKNGNDEAKYNEPNSMYHELQEFPIIKIYYNHNHRFVKTYAIEAIRSKNSEKKSIDRGFIERLIDNSVTFLTSCENGDLFGVLYTEYGINILTRLIKSNNDSLFYFNLSYINIKISEIEDIVNAFKENINFKKLYYDNYTHNLDNTFEAINQIISIESIRINKLCYGNYLTNSLAKKLADTLSYNNTITSLDFDNIIIDDEGLSNLAIALSTNNSIQELRVRINHEEGINGSEKGIQALFNNLRKNKSIRILSLEYFYNFFSENTLEKEFLETFVKYLIDYLKNSTDLTKLNISCNQLGDLEIGKIINSLINHQSLNHLDLSYNLITDQGVETIAEFINTTPTLKTIDLVNNEIYCNGAKILITAASIHCPNVVYLDLNENHLDETFLNELEEIIPIIGKETS